MNVSGIGFILKPEFFNIMSSKKHQLADAFFNYDEKVRIDCGKEEETHRR